MVSNARLVAAFALLGAVLFGIAGGLLGTVLPLASEYYATHGWPDWSEFVDWFQVAGAVLGAAGAGIAVAKHRL